jgi:hypothetical protein
LATMNSMSGPGATLSTNAATMKVPTNAGSTNGCWRHPVPPRLCVSTV